MKESRRQKKAAWNVGSTHFRKDKVASVSVLELFSAPRAYPSLPIPPSIASGYCVPECNCKDTSESREPQFLLL